MIKYRQPATGLRGAGYATDGAPDRLDYEPATYGQGLEMAGPGIEGVPGRSGSEDGNVRRGSGPGPGSARVRSKRGEAREGLSLHEPERLREERIDLGGAGRVAGGSPRDFFLGWE